MQAKFSHQRCGAIRSNNYFNKRHNLQWFTAPGGSWNCQIEKCASEWRDGKSNQENYFYHSLSHALSGLRHKTAALLVTPILDLFSCCVLTHLQSGHQVVLVTCTGPKLSDTIRWIRLLQRNIASGFTTVNEMHHVIITSHNHLERGLFF